MATLDDVADLLRGRNRLLVYTGAGISTASGIPDFRGPHGLWSRVDPDDFTIFRYLADPEVRRRVWRTRATTGVLDALPNRGHLAITRLWEAGLLVGCATQNVDGLHRSAGLPPEALVELHGTAATASCYSCGLEVPTRSVMERLEAGEEDPSCSVCGGILKTDVVMFGEALPPGAMARAHSMAESADAALAVGTTLGVFPAAEIPLAVADRGMPLVIINRGATEFDHRAALVIDADAGEALDHLARSLL